MPLLTRRQPLLAEGVTVEEAVRKAEEKREEKHSERSKTLATATSSEAYILARTGVPFAEAREYQPLLQRTMRAQRLALQTTYREAYMEAKRRLTEAGVPEKEAEKAAREAAAEAAHAAEATIHEAQRVGLLAAAAAAGGKKAREMLEERTREFTEKYRENVEKAYQQAMRKLREEYINAKAKALADINRVEKQYKMLKAQGVTRVKVAVDTNGDGKPDKEVEMSLDEWRQQALQSLHTYLARLDRWYEEQKRRLNEWKERMLKELPRATVEAYTTWAFQTIQAIREYLRSVYVPQVVKTYKEYYELKRKLEELKKRLDPLYEEYARQLAAIAEARGLGARGLRAESVRLVQRFREEAWRMARQLGIPEDKAREAIESYVDALRKTVTKSIRFGQAIRELQRLYDEYTARVKNMFGGIAAGRITAVARIDVILSEFEEKAKRIAKEYGLPEEAIKDYIGKLREYADTVRRKGLSWATAVERAEQVFKTWLEEAKKNFPFYSTNLPVFAKKIREKLVKELQEKGLAKEEAEKLAEHYASKYAAEIRELAYQNWQRLVPADFICQRIGKGLWCKVYRNGQLLQTFTVPEYYETSNPEEWWQRNRVFIGMALSIGYRPANLWIARNEKEFENIEMGYLRGENPREYMKHLGEKAFKWEGGINPSDIYTNIKEFTGMVEEFYRIPAERLAEKGRQEGGVKGFGEVIAASTAMFGAGALSGIMNIWDVPGMISFAKETVESRGGNIVSMVEENPLMVSYMAGTVLGAEAGLRGLGRLKRLGERAIGRYVPPEKLGMPGRITPEMPSTHRLPGLDIPHVPPEVVAKIGQAAHYSEELKRLVAEYMAGKIKPKVLVKRGLEIYEELEKKGVLGKPTIVYHATPHKFPKEFEVQPSFSPTPGLYTSPVPYPKFAVSGVTKVGLVERLRWKLEGVELPSEPSILKLRVEGVELPKLGRPLEPPPETGAYARIVPGYTKWEVFTRARGFIAKEARGQPKAYITPEVYAGLLWRLRAELESIIPVGARFKEVLRSRLLKPYTEVEVPLYKIIERQVVRGVSKEKLAEIRAKLEKEGFNRFVYSEKTGKLYAYKARPTGKYVRVKIRIREYEPVKELLERVKKGEVTPEEFAREIQRLQERGAIELEARGGGAIYTTGLAERGALVGRSVLGISASLRAVSLATMGARSLEMGFAREKPWAKEREGLQSRLGQPVEHLVPREQPGISTAGRREAWLETPSTQPAIREAQRLEGPATPRMEAPKPGIPRLSEPTIPRPEKAAAPKPREPVPPRPMEAPKPRPPQPQRTPLQPETPPPPPEEISPTPLERPPPPPERIPPPRPERITPLKIQALPPLPGLENAQNTWGKTSMETPRSVVGELLLF